MTHDPSSSPSSLCADCGIEVERRGEHTDGTVRWGHRVSTRPKAFVLCCRTEIEGSRLISADYHFVEGETQRHFRDE